MKASPVAKARAKQPPPELEEEDATSRDFVMARLAAARHSALATIEAIDEAMGLFVNPEDDGDGSERTELVQTALEAAGCTSRALESAEERIEDIDPEECEPWDADDDDDEDD